MLEQLLAADVFTLLLVFARVGAAFVVLPGFGEVYIPQRMRLLFAVAVTLVLAPVVAKSLPGLPASPLALFMLIAGEVVIGLMLGTLARILMAALHISGTIMGFQSGLANATMFDPANAQQGSLIGTFLGIVGLLLVFTADLHHMLLLAIADSYSLFQPGASLPLGDMSEMVVRTMGRSFALAVQIAAPLIVAGMVFYLGLGLLNRLMPQIQVFFIALPIQIVLAFAIFALTLSAGLFWFLSNFESVLLETYIRG